MELHAVTDVVVHIGVFRNVDLFQEGFYHLRLSALQELSGGKTTRVTPHLFNSFVQAPPAPASPDQTPSATPPVTPPGTTPPGTPRVRRKSPRWTRRRGLDIPPSLPAAVMEDEGAFRTKSILIKFSEERTFEMNDIAQFRVEHNVGASVEFLLEVKLMFAELKGLITSMPGAGSDTEILRALSPTALGDLPFSEVSSRKFRLHGLSNGMHALCPVDFDQMHFVHADLMVHASLVDFRLRVRKKAEWREKYIQATPAMQTEGHRRPPGRETVAVAVPSCLSEALGELSVHTAAGGNFPAAAGEEVGEKEDLCGAALAEILDSLQRDHIDRLAKSRQQLVDFLKSLRQRWKSLLLLPRFEKPIVLPGLLEDEEDLHSGATTPCGSTGTASRTATPGMPNGDALGGDLSDEEGREPQDDEDESQALPLARRCRNMRKAAAVRLLISDLNFASQQVLEVWRYLLRVIAEALEEVASFLRTTWLREALEQWGESFLCEDCPADTVAAMSDEIQVAHARAAANLRQSRRFRSLAPLPIEDLSASLSADVRPIVFEQRYGRRGAAKAAVGRWQPLAKTSSTTGESRDDCLPEATAARGGTHVIVLVHGFHGNSFDVRLLRNTLSLRFPSACCLCAIANEDGSDSGIAEMGERLASEVSTFLERWFPGSPEPSLGRLSFVAHSVGGLVVRAALPLLPQYHKFMHTYLSFSSPHFGYLYAPTKLFKTGLWVAAKWRASQCLEQLALTDSPDADNTYICQLAQQPGLEHFQHVVLTSSFQDQYAPPASARMEMTSAAKNDPKLGALYSRMLRYVLRPLKVERIMRLDVDFQLPETNIDTMIGRAAHIEFIDNELLTKMIIYRYSYLFD